MSSLFKNLPHKKELKDKMLETKEKVRAPMTSHKGGTEKSEQFLSKFNVGKDLSLSLQWCEQSPFVTRLFCLVESHSQGTAANAVLSVCLTTVLFYHLQLFIDIEGENLVSIHCVSLLDLHATINLYYIE